MARSTKDFKETELRKLSKAANDCQQLVEVFPPKRAEPTGNSHQSEARKLDSALFKLIDALAREAARRDYASQPTSPFLDNEAGK